MRPLEIRTLCSLLFVSMGLVTFEGVERTYAQDTPALRRKAASAPVLLARHENKVDLPHYEVDMTVDTSRAHIQARERVHWTNTGTRPVQQIVLNAHARYAIPHGEIGLLAKILEVLRMSPREAMSFSGPALHVTGVQRQIAAQATDPLGSAKSGGAPPRSGIEKNLKPTRPWINLVKGLWGDTTTHYGTAKGETPPEPTPAKAGGVTRAHHLERVFEGSRPLDFDFSVENPTALVVTLDEPLGVGERVTLDLDLIYNLPPKKGRWGQWKDVTMLAQGLPVVAVLEGDCWKPTPFIPWHQPFYNEAGMYSVRMRIPCDQKVAASAAEQEVHDEGGGWRIIVFQPTMLREFSFVASSRFCEFFSESDGVKIRCLCLPEHKVIARTLVDATADAIPVYNRWFGRYPYPQFTIVEAYFGWNGNECGGMVMIDDRMMSMPYWARNYPIYLIQHELCHQWWYNVVGTNGYAETWMDEGLATYLSHRLADDKLGKNNKVIQWPWYLDWLPNIRRDDLRNYGLIGAQARGDRNPVVQDMEKYSHLPNLLASTYDRGHKVVGMIEERMGAEAFLDFLKNLYARYQFRILRVADFQRELEDYTHQSWEEFFRYWVHGAGSCDWSVEKVEFEETCSSVFAACVRRRECPVPVTIRLKQKGGFNEPTVLGIRIEGREGYQIRVPIYPDAPVLEFDEFQAKVECVTHNNSIRPGENQCEVKVTVVLPKKPLQITVDPDKILLDDRPTNNHWKSEHRWHLTPLYTQLDDADVTNAFDRWNYRAGPWAFLSSYNDPWFARGTMLGLRAGIYRTQEFSGGLYAAYRSDGRNVVAGIDGLWDHVPLPHTQIGFNVERSLANITSDNVEFSRGVVFGRYVMMYGSSLYLPPFEYVETFGVMQERSLPNPRITVPGAELFKQRPGLGLHYHKNLMTPYWDAEGGAAFDITYQYGLPAFGNDDAFHLLYGQFSIVKTLPSLIPGLDEVDTTGLFRGSRLAFRVAGSTSVPQRGQFFALGGGDHFRGFDLQERQGNSTWLGSVEWRVPVMQNLEWDFCDHFIGIRNIYVAPFYDVGNAYLNGQALGSPAHAVGAGLRVDVSWLGLIERTMIRFDAAQTVNVRHPTQFWFGIQHPF